MLDISIESEHPCQCQLSEGMAVTGIALHFQTCLLEWLLNSGGPFFVFLEYRTLCTVVLNLASDTILRQMGKKKYPLGRPSCQFMKFKHSAFQHSSLSARSEKVFSHFNAMFIKESRKSWPYNTII